NIRFFLSQIHFLNALLSNQQFNNIFIFYLLIDYITFYKREALDTEEMKELQKLNKYFLKYKYRFLVGIIITVASQIFTVFTPQFVGDAINILQDFLQNKISAETTRQGLWNNMMLIIGTTLIAGFLTFLMRQTIIVMSRHIEFDLKNEIYEQYQKIRLDFYIRQRTGDLMRRITVDDAKVRQHV